tara:strand:- start:2463 stop:2759 length:297 start_codon:yes stop_codon:yes gene_type:complete
MELTNILKILTIAASCRNRAKMLLIENQYLDDHIFDALVAYTGSIIETINLLSEIVEFHYENLNTVECLEIMKKAKNKIEHSAIIENELSKYISLTVH